jgi:hypothetical protein
MQTDRIQRLLPLAGVGFEAVMLAALSLTRGEADASASTQTIFDYWHGHHGAQLVAALVLAPYGAALLVLFAAVLCGTVRAHETEESLYPPVMFAGAVIAAVGLTLTGAVDAATATSAHRGARDAVYTLAQLQSYDWVPWVVGFGVMLLAAGIGALRTRALPKLLCWPAVVLGALFLTPAGFFAAFVLPVWTAATGIALYRENSAVRTRGSRANRPRRRPRPSVSSSINS